MSYAPAQSCVGNLRQKQLLQQLDTSTTVFASLVSTCSHTNMIAQNTNLTSLTVRDEDLGAVYICSPPAYSQPVIVQVLPSLSLQNPTRCALSGCTCARNTTTASTESKSSAAVLRSPTGFRECPTSYGFGLSTWPKTKDATDLSSQWPRRS